MNQIKNFFSKQRLINIINILFVLSIILDLHIFYNSISTLLRIGVISLLFLIIFVFYSNKKERKYLYLYFGLLLIYIVFHILSINQFDVPHYSDYSVIKELLYFVKMAMNVCTIFIIYKTEYDLNNFKNTVLISTLLIAGSIVICNIFKIGYTSYNFNQLEYSIFDWLKEDTVSFSRLSSKGFFHLTNQISALLTLYFNIILIYLKENVNWKYIFTLLLTTLSMIILGTRVANYMPMILTALAFLIYLVLFIIKREKFNIKFIITLIVIFIFGFCLFQISPLQLRNNYYDDIYKKSDKIDNNSNVNTTTENKTTTTTKAKKVEDMTNAELKKHLKKFHIKADFYRTYYKLEYDRDFYENYLKLPAHEKNDTRNLEKQVIKRVKYLNNNKNDDYFGIGYERVMNIFNIEKDYVVQYYQIGIIGCILILGVNILILIWAYFKILFNLARYFNYKNCMLLIAGSFFLIVSYFSGNLLNAISCIFPISMIMGIIINELRKDTGDHEYESYLGLKTTLKNEKEIIKDIFKSDKQNILFNINPVVVMNNRKNVDNLEVINKQNYNIPDGNGIVFSSRLKSGKLKDVIPGIDLMESICKEAAKKDYSIYLYGAEDESVKKTKEYLEKTYKKINIVGFTNGYEKEEVAIKNIKKAKPDILFVALGSPLQENFIINNLKSLKDIKIIMPVGGSFDVLSGKVKRAPKRIRKLKLEWLYRMIVEPKRIKNFVLILEFLALSFLSDIDYKER